MTLKVPQSNRAMAEVLLLLIGTVAVSEYFLSTVAVLVAVFAFGLAWAVLPLRYAFLLALLDATFAFLFMPTFTFLVILSGEAEFGGGFAQGIFVLAVAFLLYFSIVVAVGCVIGFVLRRVGLRKGQMAQVTRERLREKLLASKAVNV